MKLNILMLFLFMGSCCVSQPLKKDLHSDSLRKTWPAVALENPVGGGELGTVCVSLSIQDKSRLGNAIDGSGVVYIGFGEPERFIGAGATIHVYGLTNNLGEKNNQGAHSLNLHLNKLMFKKVLLDLGIDNALLSKNVILTNYITFVRSFYFSANYLAQIKHKNFHAPFSFISITAGAGNGYYRSDNNFKNKGSDGFDPFFSFASPLSKSTNLIVEWNGYDVGAGISSIPIKKIPLIFTLDITDVLYGKPKIVTTFSIPLYISKLNRRAGLTKGERPIGFKAIRPVRTL